MDARSVSRRVAARKKAAKPGRVDASSSKVVKASSAPSCAMEGGPCVLGGKTDGVPQKVRGPA